MKKFRISYIVFVVLFGMCFTACGQENVESVTPPAPTESIVVTETPTPTTVTEPTEAVTPTEKPEPTATPVPTQAPSIWDEDFPCLAEAYEGYFSMGVAIGAAEAVNVLKQEVIASQFNSLTLGNEMKADYVLDWEATVAAGDEECPVLNFDNAKPALDFCYKNGIPMRGHTLVWHSQTPRWFFTEGYSKDPNAPLVSKELMLKRMENYIRLEMEFFNTNYPGLIYAWDVINEAVEFNGGEDGYRAKGSLYYEVIGKDFFEKAFEYARKYAAPDQKLFYNDYNTHETQKMKKIIEILEPLVAKGLVDGVGLQSHLGITAPSIGVIRSSIREYAKLGIEIHITELDVDQQKNTESAQLMLAGRYKALFTMFRELKDEGVNITNVTIWGLTDDGSWLNDSTPSWPLLFTKMLDAKPAYWGVMLDEYINSLDY